MRRAFLNTKNEKHNGSTSSTFGYHRAVEMTSKKQLLAMSQEEFRMYSDPQACTFNHCKRKCLGGEGQGERFTVHIIKTCDLFFSVL